MKNIMKIVGIVLICVNIIVSIVLYAVACEWKETAYEYAEKYQKFESIDKVMEGLEYDIMGWSWDSDRITIYFAEPYEF